MKYSIGNINDYKDEELNSFYNKIPLIKRKKIDKKITLSKKRSIIGELLLSQMIDYNNIDYFINDNGKPFIKNSKIYHNISHSHDYVITAISDKEIGIDIEKIRKTNSKTIERYATKKEKDYILSSKNDIEKRIFEIFSLKEAYYKMNGTSLDDALKTEFIIKNNKVSCSNKNIKSKLLDDIEGYIIAYCEKKNS